MSSYQCDPDTTWQEFALSKQIYEAETGRKRTPENDVISYLIVQSFKPGEISPQDANKLGYQLALEFTGGQHQFLVATHVDKKHIHCHIEFNSTTLDCSHKFNNYWNTYQAIRKINDRLSQEHGLSLIEKPKEKGKSPFRRVATVWHTLGFDTSMCRATSTERTIQSFFWRTRMVSR